MSIKVNLDCYIALASNYFYGKKFLDEPQEVQDILDEYFDGLDLSDNHGGPDDLYLNIYTVEPIEYYAEYHLGYSKKEIEDNEKEISKLVKENCIENYVFLYIDEENIYFLQ